MQVYNLTSNGEFLPVMEEFYSLQGEGANTGKAAYFLRLGGCNVGCVFCDVKESWNPHDHPISAVEDMVHRVLLKGADTVIITGGEPLLYPLDRLCSLLQAKKIKVFLETSGTSPFSGHWDWVCLSPKKQRLPLPENYQHANELKIVVGEEKDFLFAEQQAALVPLDCLLFLQPEWNVYQTFLPKIIDYILRHPQWRISLQSHKFMEIP